MSSIGRRPTCCQSKFRKTPDQNWQAILGKNIGLVVGNADKVPVVRGGDSRIGKLRVQHGQPARDHETLEDPAGEHRFDAVVTWLPVICIRLAIRCA